MISALARLPVARLVRTPRTWIAASAWCALAIGMAVVMRGRGASHGADDVLIEAYGALVLPLLAYTLVGTTLGARSIAGSTTAVAAFGASRARAAAVTVGVGVGASALGGALLAATVAVVAHGTADPPLARDALASGYVGALGGAAYASWFSLGAGFGRRGGGRVVALVVDWLLGANGGVTALFAPRAHLRNLLGGAPPMDLSQRASAMALGILVVVCALGAVGRSRA
ncbi:MAG: hypothetical protein ACLP1X_06380 [Polyangiaceae bacterium]